MSLADFVIFLLVVVGLCWFIHLCRTFTSNGRHKPPPGPIGLPLIGSLHMLGKHPHRTLYKMSQKYGPIMSLRLGLIPTIVVSSPAAAELVLKTHDAVFANRPKVQFSDSKTMAFSEFGGYWRSVRKFCNMELLSPTKIDSMAGLRKEELGFVVEWLKNAAGSGQVVNVSEKVARLIEDMTCRMLLGKSRDERFNLTEVLNEMTKATGAFNVADFIPFLAPLDLQGLVRKAQVTGKALDKILETIIDEHEEEAREGYKKLDKDFVDVLLSLKNNPPSIHEQLAKNIDRSNIKAIILDIIFGSVETSITAIEWIMTELMRHKRLVHSFDWELPFGMSPDELDMDETFGLSLPRTKHLLAIPKIRQC
ncbi:Ferulate-5-hydroxylase [Heracleum sosnowskyi]|uniref:Ferulate-5-hydroxylase n=1 Tax=Heracleum sosnowskyi TaxID=360622 RepID=A0AAD8MWV0_9APIA|nr:Ferulate-5-hydroxylase [Heracleum sosnowskyi]